MLKLLKIALPLHQDSQFLGFAGRCERLLLDYTLHLYEYKLGIMKLIKLKR